MQVSPALGAGDACKLRCTCKEILLLAYMEADPFCDDDEVCVINLFHSMC